MKKYDVIVVGGGHAGIEAALASSRLDKKTALITLYIDTIAMMSCNPSIGGPGKSNLVTEIDILGGEIGRHIDEYNIQLKHLNESKGPAAKITRAQADKYKYRIEMKKKLEKSKNLNIIQDCVEEIILENDKVIGIKTRLGIKYEAKAVILATGTFLKGKVIIGDVVYSAGRQGESSAEKLSDNLKDIGIDLLRYQTATPPRINKRSIDFSKVQEMNGEEQPNFFSIFTKKEKNINIPTWLTYTNEKTIEVTKEMLKYSPIYSGIIDTHGPRHCPSIDRKVSNFPDKMNHQIFLEQESLFSEEIYVNGFTTAMPPFAQEKILRTIEGLENSEIIRHGYAVEYDYAPASQLKMSLENKKIEGLFFAGQINGTSGYEEAAAQGFIAGVNAARKIEKKDPIILNRADGYIGLLIDDIIHKKTPEPYRVLPSRAEYRLSLRFDNAFMRLYDKTKEIGLLSEEKIEYIKNSVEIVKKEIEKLKELNISMVEANEILKELGAPLLTKGVKVSDLLKIKEVTYDNIREKLNLENYPTFIKNQIETMIKYEIFIEREIIQIEKFKEMEEMKLPKNINYLDIKGISNIAKSGLIEVGPLSLGEASRISGVTANDLAILIGYLKKEER